MKLPVFYIQIVANKADLMRVQGEGDEENGESLELGCTVGGLRSMIHGKEMSCT